MVQPKQYKDYRQMHVRVLPLPGQYAKFYNILVRKFDLI